MTGEQQAAKRPGFFRRWFRRILLVTTLTTVMLVATNTWVALHAAPFLFRGVTDVPMRSVAIVPGAGVHADGTPSDALEDRLEAALHLYQAGRVRRILVSGDHGSRDYDEVNAMHRWLIERGVPAGDVFLDHAGFRTLDTMARASRVFLVRDAIICTQRSHLARAVYLARQQGIDALGVVADRRAYQGFVRNQLREAAARTIAVGDVHLWDRQPTVLGDVIPITGPASLSYDSATVRD